MRLIDADRLIRDVESFNRPLCDGYHMKKYVLDQILTDIRNAPTIDVVPARHGKWLWLDGVRCSQCNYKLATTGLPSYCPNCGARMGKE